MSMINRFTRASWRCRLSSGFSPRASSGPLYPILTCAVTQPVYFATMVLLDRRADCIVAESVEPARTSRWLETALFSARAEN